MAERKRVEDEGGGAYFDAPPSKLEVISSGSTLLDCVLGGGYPLGRIVNIVGDKSTNKTGLNIEAAANFAMQYPHGRIWYREVEAAMDLEYAQKLGLPIDRVEFPPQDKSITTVEDVFKDMEECIASVGEDECGLYILDSLDALSDKAEQERDIDEGTYGATKARKLSELFRRVIQKLGNKRITVIIVSQIRDNIGVTFGKKYSRSGGKALDFYASQIIYLAYLKMVKKQSKVAKAERAYAIDVKCKVEKNKIASPLRDCDIRVVFHYGVDDVYTSLNWLNEIGVLEREIGYKRVADYMKKLDGMGDEDYLNEKEKVDEIVKRNWQAIEEETTPNRRKYT